MNNKDLGAVLMIIGLLGMFILGVSIGYYSGSVECSMKCVERGAR